MLESDSRSPKPEIQKDRESQSLRLGSEMLESDSRSSKAEIQKDDDYKLLYDWIIQWFDNSGSRPIQKMINQIVNSYSPWRKIYDESKRQSLAFEMITKMSDVGLITINKIGKMSLVARSS